MPVEKSSTTARNHIILAADARFSQPDYANDISWLVSLGKGQAYPFSLNSTFGLRARSMQMFPRLVDAEIGPGGSISSPQPPDLRIVRNHPNFLRLTFSPLPEIEMIMEIWVPSSHVITGQIEINNRSVLRRKLRFDWAALLSPMNHGHGMAAILMEKTYVLEGKTSELCPILLLTGGPRPGPSSFPTLGFDMDLYPGNQSRFRWAMGIQENAETSLELAQAAVSRDWEPEIALIELVNASQHLKITTGDPAWNEAFDSAQHTAFQLFMPGGSAFPARSFVQSRTPDRGYSLRGDGSDYDPKWSGQTALDAWYLNQIILPAAPDLAAGVVDNFLAVQQETGEIDWKPGLAKQRMHMLAQPLLATLALQVQNSRPDPAWVESVFPGLLRFFDSWFAPAHDQDGDGFPEWGNRIQIGLDDHPLFDRWLPANQGIDPADVETPVLAALLCREGQSLVSLAAAIGREEEANRLRQRIQSLTEQIESTWDALESTYCYRDMFTGQRPRGTHLLTFHSSGQHEIRQSLESPQKLVLNLYGQSNDTRHARITIHGLLDGQAVDETITPGQVQWMNLVGHASTTSRFTYVEGVDIEGLRAEDYGRLRTADLTRKDITLLLPLWARIPSRERARQLIQETLLPQFLQPYGLPVCPSSHLLPEQQHLNRVFLPWNVFVLEGLLAYGYQETAADLFTRLMNAICQNRAADGHFFSSFSASNGKPDGDADTLAALPPVGVFLQILGLRKLSNREIILEGLNPFPWPVTVQYQGIQLSFHPGCTEIRTANENLVMLNTPGPHRILLP